MALYEKYVIPIHKLFGLTNVQSFPRLSSVSAACANFFLSDAHFNYFSLHFFLAQIRSTGLIAEDATVLQTPR